MVSFCCLLEQAGGAGATLPGLLVVLVVLDLLLNHHPGHPGSQRGLELPVKLRWGAMLLWTVLFGTVVSVQQLKGDAGGLALLKRWRLRGHLVLFLTLTRVPIQHGHAETFVHNPDL